VAKGKVCTAPFIGVCLVETAGELLWAYFLYSNGEHSYQLRFRDPVLAAHAYDKAVRDRGLAKPLNFPTPAEAASAEERRRASVRTSVYYGVTFRGDTPRCQCLINGAPFSKAFNARAFQDSRGDDDVDAAEAAAAHWYDYLVISHRLSRPVNFYMVHGVCQGATGADIALARSSGEQLGERSPSELSRFLICQRDGLLQQSQSVRLWYWAHQELDVGDSDDDGDVGGGAVAEEGAAGGEKAVLGRPRHRLSTPPPSPVSLARMRADADAEDEAWERGRAEASGADSEEPEPECNADDLVVGGGRGGQGGA
jgi:hypothetical protein